MLEQNSVAYRILELIALSGEVHYDTLILFCRRDNYTKKLITQLKSDGLIKTASGQGVKGYRLTTQAKKMLLRDNSPRFQPYITGAVETNRIKSEATRRIRLHRIADAAAMMLNSNIPLFPDDKPELFRADAKLRNCTLQLPLFYTSREFKQIGDEMLKIKNARSVGVLLTETEPFLVYNTGGGVMKWNGKSEMRVQVVLQYYLRNKLNTGQFRRKDFKALVFGAQTEIAYSLLTNTQQNHFLLDGNFPNFYFFTLDWQGEILLRLLSNDLLNRSLRQSLMKGYRRYDSKLNTEHDAIAEDGRLILFNYFFDLPRLARFDTALSLRKRKGTVICFDYQKSVMEKYCSENVTFEVIVFERFVRGFFSG